MHVWALCLVCLYVFLGVFNWLTGLHWLGEFSLPLSILAGLGLAIASNSAPKNSAAMPAAANTHDMPENAAPPMEAQDTAAGQSSTASPSPGSTAPEPSISFTINKNARPQ